MSDSDTFLRIDEVCRMVGVKSQSTIYNWIREGSFPAQIKVNDRVSVWSRRDVEAWIANVKAGLPPDVRTLV